MHEATVLSTHPVHHQIMVSSNTAATELCSGVMPRGQMRKISSGGSSDIQIFRTRLRSSVCFPSPEPVSFI